MRAAVYARVSTGKQVKGYSLDQQIEALQEHAASEGYEEVEEYPDPGYSGTSLERPGMDALRDAVEAGRIDVVFAQDADRITREPAHRMLLDEDFKKHGTRLIALDDWGDDSHEGSLLKFMKGWTSKGENIKRAERVKRNKRKKARGGMIVGGHTRAYGFEWVKNTDNKTVGYEINEEEMSVVRRIFEDVASGVGIRTVKERLDSEHVPTPSGGPVWNRQFLRDMLMSDLYRPHAVEQLEAEGVGADVLARLDSESFYGLYRYQDIPVPVPGAGIPSEIVLRARQRIKDNVPTSKNAGRFWELSGGILFCSECKKQKRRMQTHTVKKGGERAHYYYRCQSMTSGKADKCGNKKHVHAGRIEAEVWESVRRVVDDQEYVLEKMEEHFEQKRRELSRLSGGDMRVLAKRLEQIEKSWTKIKLAYEADALTIADLKSRRTELDEEREAIEREMRRSRDQEAELERLDETEAEIRERVESDYGDLSNADAEKRREVYQDTQLRVEVGADGVPHISGIFPARYGDMSGKLWKTPEGRGYFIEPPVGSGKTSSSRPFTRTMPPAPLPASRRWVSSRS